MNCILGSGTKSRLHTADNCLLLNVLAERVFGNVSFVILPMDGKDKFILRWKIQATNSAAVLEDMGNGLKLRDIDVQGLAFRNDRRPAAKSLYYHFFGYFFSE